MKAAEAKKPPKEVKNEAEVERLRAALGRVRFFTNNERTNDAVSFLNDVLAPYQAATESTLTSSERHRIGELLHERGRASRKLGDSTGALADSSERFACGSRVMSTHSMSASRWVTRRRPSR